MKVGDRVKVYDICTVTNQPTVDKGTVKKYYLDGHVFVEMDTWGTKPNNAFWFHEKQCRRLVKKKQKKFNPNDIKNALEVCKLIREFNKINGNKS